VFKFEDSFYVSGPPAFRPKNQDRGLNSFAGARTIPNYLHSRLYDAPLAIRALRARKAVQGAWKKNHPSGCWKKLLLA